MTQPLLKAGQIWVKMDPREERYVLILDAWHGWARIRRVNADGSAFPKSRALNANSNRFDGRRGGYAIHKDI